MIGIFFEGVTIHLNVLFDLPLLCGKFLFDDFADKLYGNAKHSLYYRKLLPCIFFLVLLEKMHIVGIH